MAALARDLITHKVYRAANGGDRKSLESLLSEERKKNPKRIPYFFSACRKTPGKFCLAYQPGNKPIIEYFSLCPDGYRYRGKIHSTANDLITWFKGHYRDPIPRPTPSSQSMPPPHHAHHTHRPYHTPQQPVASPLTSSMHLSQPHRHYHTPQQPVASPMSSIRTGGNTPYTPQWPTSTPPPHYGGHHTSYPQQQYSGYGGNYQQQYRGGTTGAPPYHGGNYQGGYQDRGRGGGGWPHQQNWASRHTPSSPLGTPIQDE